MRVLFLSGAEGPDYQCDLLFHGLRELLGEEVIDARPLWFMYRTPEVLAVKHRLYGKGFTVYGRLPELPVDRSDVEAKIRARYYDLVVYGSVWRNLDGFALVRACYPPEKIAFVDGEDGTQVRDGLPALGRYFKRECLRESKGCLPISFAIPRELIRSSPPVKKKALATVIPGRPETYVFNDEQAYYDDYGTSMVAITTKKAGWDCLRHYEILANGCVPYFLNLKDCPSHTMTTLPKRSLLKVLRWPTEAHRVGEEVFDACLRFTREYLTTERLARDFLDAVKRGRASPPAHGGKWDTVAANASRPSASLRLI